MERGKIHVDDWGPLLRETPLKDVLITHELQQRVRRPADYQRENNALHTLMSLFSAGASNLLQVLAETLRTLCGADSAGICVENAFP
jgi:hypothetical protein